MTRQSLSFALCDALAESIPDKKVEKARQVYSDWMKDRLSFDFSTSPPKRPGRPDQPTLLSPSQMPKRRKAGSLGNRIALLHAVAHIEFNAIDLALDIVGRFGHLMPKAFTDDWLKVADDEARHFTMINDRLCYFNSFYGALPAHDGLWESSMATAHDLAARLAIVPMVLEARGLDVTPSMVERFRHFQDPLSADILEQIYTDEVSHVEAGTVWFRYLCEKENKDHKAWYQDLVKTYFKGLLKRPFNVDARTRANLPHDWYDPLADLI
ncbi:ferritin-like domain-containing protein [Temperatibacter marinus]|uniref:Ferritin-like domain-containing protein n=1 Tax=Temperatibacter marinus TaxID=1456591 RepID=A0AA52EHR6_9PROT|nr:ferritin-like domain-containing protein [Temperatibacter marinus]WND02276.1 ferritin-like domain-containing protein [Temperatibacter marinus]